MICSPHSKQYAQTQTPCGLVLSLVPGQALTRLVLSQPLTVAQHQREKNRVRGDELPMNVLESSTGAIVLAGPYYRSLSYEIREDEVVVRVGIITKSVKHVPFRMVTNVTVKRGILDRWFFDLGTLNIQTAGMSGSTGAEESLVGLANYDEVYEMVAAELRRFRGGMAPTVAAGDVDPPEALTAILDEVRAIRQALDARA